MPYALSAFSSRSSRLTRASASSPLKDPEPEHGLAWFVLNAFFFVGVALVVTLGIGIAFGSFRVWLLEKFPHNRFNGTPDDDPGETFRLNDTGE